MPRTKRIATIPGERCIRRDATSVEVEVRVKGAPTKRKRWPLEVWDTPAGRARVRAWRDGAEAESKELLAAFGTPIDVARGSLIEASEWTFKQIKDRPAAASDCSHIRAWWSVVLPKPYDQRPLGEWQVDAIEVEHINLAIGQWRAAPAAGAVRLVRVSPYTRPAAKVGAHEAAATSVVAHQQGGRAIVAHTRAVRTIKAHERKAASAAGYVRRAPATTGGIVRPRTIAHRVRMLREVILRRTGRVLVGKVVRPKVAVDGRPATIPAELLAAVLVKLRTDDPLTFARYAVHCTTWQRPCQIGRADPDDLNLDAGFWIVRDAKNEPAHPIELTGEAIDAWRAFIAVNAWGPFDTAAYGRAIHRAGLPPAMRPYSAKHTGAQAFLLAGGGPDKLSAHLGHASNVTTRKFYSGFVRDHSREIATFAEGRFPSVFAKPRLVKKK